MKKNPVVAPHVRIDIKCPTKRFLPRAQGLPGWVSGDLWRGFLVALALTSLSGMVTRYISDPSRNPTPFILGLTGATVIGSTIYLLLGGPGFRPVRPYAPYGYHGYLIGSMTGLFLLAVVSALRPGRRT